MGSTRSLVWARPTAQEQEWADAELLEQVELLEVQAASLETERDRLATELSIARSWVKDLALWLDEAQMRTGRKALPAWRADDLAGMILSPRTVRLLREGEAAPIAWGGSRSSPVSFSLPGPCPHRLSISALRSPRSLATRFRPSSLAPPQP